MRKYFAVIVVKKEGHIGNLFMVRTSGERQRLSGSLRSRTLRNWESQDCHNVSEMVVLRKSEHHFDAVFGNSLSKLALREVVVRCPAL